MASAPKSKGIEAVYPLSPLQEGILFHAVQEPEAGAYIVQYMADVCATIDRSLLQRAWTETVAQHQSLRSVFAWETTAQPLQAVKENVDTTISFVDGSSSFEAALSALSTKERNAVQDLKAAPLVRAALIERKGGSSVLIITYHHIILDGWSLYLVLQEVIARYNAFASEDTHQDNNTPQYQAFIDWLSHQDQRLAQEYWKERLRGFSQPTGYTATASGSEDGYDEIELRISREQTRALREFAREHKLTLATVIQGAWAILLSRYTGEADVCFGATTSVRPTSISDVESMAGLLINTLPLRVDVQPDFAVCDWLRTIQAGSVDMQSFAHSALNEVQRQSDVPPGTLLFDNIVVVENVPQAVAKPKKGQLTLRNEKLSSNTNFPLTLVVFPGEEISLLAQFQRSKYDQSFITRLVQQMEQCIASMLEDAEASLSSITILPESQQAEIFDLFAPTLQQEGPTETIVDLFLARCEEAPTAIAVSCDGNCLTYEQLQRRAVTVARELIERGVEPETLVTVCLERNENLIVAILGVLFAGGAYVPLDPAYPKSRLDFIIEDTESPVVITTKDCLEQLRGAASAVVDLDAIDFANEQATPRDLGVRLESSNLAYVIYTSGSTGNPKGVLVTHGNVVRLFKSTECWFDFNASDVWTMYHSYAFDFSVWEIWGALLYGGRLAVVPYWISRSPEAFRALLSDERVTVLNQTPSAFKQLMHVEEGTEPDDRLPLRWIVFGGEALDIRSLAPWVEKYGDDAPKLINMYGITETTVHVTYRRITAADARGAPGSLIGLPIPDLSLFILGTDQRLCPIGVPGEIHVGGLGLARGYLKRADLTAARFVDDFELGEHQLRLYRSGDLAKYTPNGDIEYVGRADNQVKISGFRIELGEIDHTLLEMTAISDCITTVRADKTGHKQLVAYYIGTPGNAPSTEDIRDFLTDRLPAHCVPKSFVALDTFPLTGNGKLDYKALPAPTDVVQQVFQQRVVAEGPVETAIATVLCDVLAADSIGATDNFFHVGGDSILSIRAVSKLRRAGYRITPKQLFEHPTVRELAKLVQTEADDSRAVDELPTGEIPLTPIQNWFFAKRFRNIHHWNQAFAFSLEKDVDEDTLKNAVWAVVKHHPSFRLRFHRRGDSWTQRYAERANVSVEVADSSGDAVRGAVESAQTALNISEGPLAAFRILHDGDGSRTLLIVVHHLIVDGVSWQILLDDIEACLMEGPSSLLPTTMPFGRWPEQLSEYAKTEVHAAAVEYWQSFADELASECANKDALANDSNLDGGTNRRTLEFSIKESRVLLREAPQRFRCTTNELLLAALASALARWSGNARNLVDLEGHGREDVVADVDLSRSIGWYTTLFPFLLEAKEDDIEATINIVKQRLRALPNKGLDFGIAREDTKLADLRSGTVFNYLGDLDQITADSEYFAFSALDTEPWRDPGSTRSHQIEISAFVQDGVLRTWWIHNPTTHSEASLQELQTAFQNAVQHLVERQSHLDPLPLSQIDFPLAELASDELARLPVTNSDVEDIYRVSPIQALHLSLAESIPGLGVDQWYLKLNGDLSTERLQRAWSKVLSRHQLLRSTFLYENVRLPHVLINRHVEISIAELDWRDESNQESALAHQLEQQRESGFKLSEAPLTRLTLIRLTDAASVLIWTNHHLQLDGWSWPLVLADVGRHYADINASADEQAPAQYVDFARWLSTVDEAQDRQFWKQQLNTFASPSRLPGAASRRPAAGRDTQYDEHSIRLSAPLSEELVKLARSIDGTLTNVLFSAWSVVLAASNETDDVVFGAAFSGRPAELENVEQIVGPFVNDLPVRLTVGADLSIDEMLSLQRSQQFAITQHQQTPLEVIQDCSSVSWRHRLFESLLVVQNYVTGEIASVFGTDVRVDDVVGGVRTNYPLTIVVAPGEDIEITLVAHREAFEPGALEGIGEAFRNVLQQMTNDVNKSVGDLFNLIPASLRNHAHEAASSPNPVHITKVEAADNTELKLLGIWRDEFEIRDMDVEDSWADFGVQSALILRIHRRIGEIFERQLSIAKMYEHPTIRSMARYLNGDSDDEALNTIESRAKRAREAARKRGGRRRKGTRA